MSYTYLSDLGEWDESPAIVKQCLVSASQQCSNIQNDKIIDVNSTIFHNDGSTEIYLKDIVSLDKYLESEGWIHDPPTNTYQVSIILLSSYIFQYTRNLIYTHSTSSHSYDTISEEDIEAIMTGCCYHNKDHTMKQIECIRIVHNNL